MKFLGCFLEALLLGCLVTITLGCSGFANVSDEKLTLEDIIGMTKARIHPDVIIHYLQRNQPGFRLSTPTIIRLTREGVDDKVILYLIEPDMDRGKYKGIMIRDPFDKRIIRGYVSIPVALWGTTFRTAREAGNAVITLSEGFAKYTDFMVKADYHLYLDTSELFRYPLLYLTTEDVFDLTIPERDNLVRYIRTGGFVFIEPCSSPAFMYFEDSLASFKQMIRDSFGDEACFAPIPDSHPLFHCFYDFYGAPYLVPKLGRDIVYPTKLFLMSEDEVFMSVPFLMGIWINDCLVGVISDNQYGRTWSNYACPSRFDNPFFRMGVNIIVYALSREEGKAKCYRDLISFYHDGHR